MFQSQVIAKLIERHEQMADKAFAEHKTAKVADYGEYSFWRCSREKSSVYAFNVSFAAHFVMVSGDIGFLGLSFAAPDGDVKAGLRKLLPDLSRTARGVPNVIPVKEFNSDLAQAWLHEQESVLKAAKGDKEERAAWRKLRQNLESALSDGEYPFMETLYNSGYCDDLPDLKTWNSNFLWCVNALKWFVSH